MFLWLPENTTLVTFIIRNKRCKISGLQFPTMLIQSLESDLCRT